MTVKEFSLIVEQPVEQILALLEAISEVDYDENTQISDVDGKRLAKRYDRTWPIKSGKPTVKKPVENKTKPVAVNINKPATPKKSESEKPVDKETPKKPAETKPVAKETPKETPKEVPSAINETLKASKANRNQEAPKPQNTTTPQNRPQNGYNNQGQSRSQNGYNNQNRPQNGYNNQNGRNGQSGYNGQGQNHPQNGYNNQNRPQNGYNNQNGRNGQSGYNNQGQGRSQNGYNNQGRPQNGFNNARPYNNNGTGNGQRNNQRNNIRNNNSSSTSTIQPKKTLHHVEDEIIESRFENLDKYDEFENEEEYEESQKNRNKTKNRLNETNRKTKTSKSRAEKRAGSIKTDKEENVVYYEPNMTVMMVAEALNVSVTELVKKLFTSMGIFASATQSIDRDTVELIAMEYSFEVKDKTVTDLVRFDEIEIVDKEEDLKPRPAIVTIMGHVDHGKTTLLDYIRSSHVTQGEAGGITQHIGAYQVEKDNHIITFIDTPGHAAFTEMRARGAQVTDIVILVVAADDGVMPQTIEAIEHAQAANVPIIVAVNKMDKPGTTADKIKQDLMNYNLLSEEWGGDTIFVPISAKTGMGVPELLEMVNLVSDMKGYKANPNRLAVGTVIEAKLDKGKGPVATLLVQNGTLKVGDVIVVGTTYGKIRALSDENGKLLKVAGPAKPVEVTGLDQVPFAGEKFMALDDEKSARAVAEIRSQNKNAEELNEVSTVSLNDLNSGDLKVLNLIIKCDVQGSIEAIKGLLGKISIEGTKVNIIGARVGAITDNDISLAIASHAIIIGFNIRPNSQITDLAKERGVEIRLYNIIYKLQEDIEAAVKGMLDPVYEEKVVGEAEVREIFKISKVGTVAGSMVTKGEIKRDAKVRVIRDSIVIYTGKIGGLRRFKDDVKEVKEGFDCGISVEGYNDLKVGDVLECFIMEEQER